MRPQEASTTLTELGFTALEADVYLLLLQEPGATGYRVAQLLGKPTANVYKALETLEQKGAVLIEDGPNRLARAIGTEELLAQIDRRFLSRRDAAARALATFRSESEDQRLYPLRSHDQVYERVRTMLRRAERIVLLDLFPEPFRILRPDLEVAVARGLSIYIEVYEPVQLPGAEVVLSFTPEQTLELWPGQAVHVVSDAREWLVALLAKGERRVVQAVWTASPFLATTQFTCLAADLIQAELSNLVAAGRPADEIAAALSRFEALRLRYTPGFEIFRAMAGSHTDEDTAALGGPTAGRTHAPSRFDGRAGFVEPGGLGQQSATTGFGTRGDISMRTPNNLVRASLGASALALASMAEPPDVTAEVPLLPRAVLFGSPDKAGPQLSPDGLQLAYLAPVDGILNIWVGPADDPDTAKPITFDRGSGVTQYFWSQDGARLIYLKDKDGDENHHVYVLDPKTGSAKDLTPIDGVRAQIAGVSSRKTGSILVGLNDRDARNHDLIELDLLTGERKLLEQNPGYFGYIADEEYRVHFALAPRPDGGIDLLRKGADGKFTNWTSIPAEDAFNTGPSGVDAEGRILYMYDSRGRNTAAAVAVDLETGKETVLAEDPRADVESIVQHPQTGIARMVTFNYDRRTHRVLDPAVQMDLDYLAGVADGAAQIVSTSLDDRRWIVGYMMDNGPYRFYLYDRSVKRAKLLFTNRKDLEGKTLAKMHSRIIKSRDGLDMISYLSLPPDRDPDGDGVPDRPVPLILQVHGGPWYRDNWGFNPSHQWATNRGYAILNVQFRGSTGFGKNFINASNGQWGAKMHDDLIDAVEWAIEHKIAPRDQVCIMGGSYGGYAVLWGLTQTPDVFRCGVDIFGVSSLVTMLESFPAYWGAGMEMMYQRIGDPRTEEGRKLLAERSPLTYVDKIDKPLLIAHGANDVRVKLAESEQLVDAMKKRKIPVTYVVYPDEGHLTFFHPQNNISFYAIAEQFLAEHLGGRAEPIGDAFEGASLEVREGAGHVAGVKEALAKIGS